MGNIFGTRSMAEEFKRNQEFIAEMNKIKTERHIQMHNQMREREMALRIAKDRELVLWLGGFYIVTVTFLYRTWKKTEKSKFLGPIIPLSFILAYYIDKGYGNKLDRIRQEAEMIMQFEPDMLELPCGLPTASSIDQARLTADEKKKLHPALPAFKHFAPYGPLKFMTYNQDHVFGQQLFSKNQRVNMTVRKSLSRIDLLPTDQVFCYFTNDSPEVIIYKTGKGVLKVVNNELTSNTCQENLTIVFNLDA